MTRCQYEGKEFTCYNQAEYILIMSQSSFGKPKSKEACTQKICKQCYEFINPDHKDVLTISFTADEVMGTMIQHDLERTGKSEPWDILMRYHYGTEHMGITPEAQKVRFKKIRKHS